MSSDPVPAHFADIMEGKPIIIITAPSGAGKTSITRHLLKRFPKLVFSISAATRSPRGTEKDGVDYYFMSADEFRQKIHEDGFVEWEMVYEGKYYGTLKQELLNIWARNQIPVLDIDVKGAIHVQQQNVSGTLSLFIEPPSTEELQRRLHSRGTETPESLQDRINKAAYELSFKKYFTHAILNEDLDKACREAEAVVEEFIRRFD